MFKSFQALVLGGDGSWSSLAQAAFEQLSTRRGRNKNQSTQNPCNPSAPRVTLCTHLRTTGRYLQPRGPYVLTIPRPLVVNLGSFLATRSLAVHKHPSKVSKGERRNKVHHIEGIVYAGRVEQSRDR